ncbi:MAG: hypothetical protein H0Z38_00515 [Firmicutes bacterium]|nr:hypothetical protein [Bacillota bacterium]
MDGRFELEKLLEGKIIKKADLTNGTVKLDFTDGTRFEREKTFEGMIHATLYDPNGKPILSTRI